MNSLYFFDFIEFLKESNKSKNTVICYSSDVKDFISTCKIFKSDQIKETHLGIFKDLLKERNLSSKTIGRKLRSVISYITFLKSLGKLKDLTTKNITIPKGTIANKTIISIKDSAKIIEISKKDKKMFIAFTILFSTGILLNELTKLKASDFLEKEECIKIKNRIIPLTDKCFYILKDYVNSKKKNEYLFTTANNTPIIDRNMRTYLSRIIKKAGVDATVNDIRNSFIVRQLEAGNSIEFVAKIAGHSSVQSTKKYLKYVVEYLDKGADKVIEI